MSSCNLSALTEYSSFGAILFDEETFTYPCPLNANLDFPYFTVATMLNGLSPHTQHFIRTSLEFIADRLDGERVALVGELIAHNFDAVATVGRRGQATCADIQPSVPTLRSI